MAARRQRLHRVGGAPDNAVVGASPGGRAVRLRGARLALLVAAVCVSGMLMLADRDEASADSSAAGPVSSSSYSPALAFANTEYSVLPMSRIFGSAEHPGFGAYAVPGNQFEYWAELKMEERSGTDLDLAFKVEGQPDASQHRYCRREWSQCRDVDVGVLSRHALRFAGKGLLFFSTSGSAGGIHWTTAFPQQRLEVSASDADSGLKVYREVLVNPPPDVQDCGEDYGDDTVEAYVCLYLGELLPSDAPTGVKESTLRASLPGLVQDKSNYSLVFAEEFDGTPPAENSAGCRDGLSTLDGSVWNYGDTCRNVDSLGESCANISGGSLQVALAYGCGVNVNTFGKLRFKYGYLEFKYTFNLDAWRGDHNLNIVAWTPRSPRQHLWRHYGVVVADWEDFLKYGDIELDLLEYVPNSRHQSFNIHANWGQPISRALPEFQTRKQFYYCGSTRNPYFQFVQNPGECRTTDTFTVTMGVEWTPRGYRTHTKVEPWHDDLTLVAEEYIEISGTVSGRRRVLPPAARSRYFEYLTADDPNTLLEQVGIAHTPNPISIGAFGITNSARHYIRTRMRIDYIRLWQPQDHYSDMEPVYQ